MIRNILKMGDSRLLRVAKRVERFSTPELTALIEDMFDTMDAARGAGLAAPQIGVDLQVVIFGFDRNERYPDAPAVPKTVLINPTIEPLTDEEMATILKTEARDHHNKKLWQYYVSRGLKAGILEKSWELAS